jgi:Flp pilus assembly pilin Flp
MISMGQLQSAWKINREKSPRMKRIEMVLKHFANDESGQDLIEYTLLMAFVALASAAIFINAGGSIAGIWGSANSQLANASISAS